MGREIARRAGLIVGCDGDAILNRWRSRSRKFVYARLGRGYGRMGDGNEHVDLLKRTKKADSCKFIEEFVFHDV